MILEVYEDNLTKNDISDVHYFSSRAIILKDKQLLLLYSKKYDYYMLPGGRIELDESPEDCVVREVLEETGFHVSVVKESVHINEYYMNSNWHTHFFICQMLTEKQDFVQWTEEEKSLDIQLVWMSQDKAMSILDQHDTAFPYGHNIMQREFLALMNSL